MILPSVWISLPVESTPRPYRIPQVSWEYCRAGYTRDYWKIIEFPFFSGNGPLIWETTFSPYIWIQLPPRDLRAMCKYESLFNQFVWKLWGASMYSMSIRKSFNFNLCKVLSKSLLYLGACVVSEVVLYFTSVILNTRKSTEILHSRWLAENALHLF